MFLLNLALVKRIEKHDKPRKECAFKTQTKRHNGIRLGLQ